MSRKTIFQYPHYQEYLRESLSESGARSGQKSKAATAAGIHTTYLSQVLSGKSHLSLEQADALAAFLDLTEDETEFLILLVLKDRAGTSKLRKRFEKQIAAKLKSRNIIQKRIPKSEFISEQDQAKFYSSVLYPAIHVLVSIPKLQKRENLAISLGISLKRLNILVDDLISMGVIAESNGILKHGPSHVHLDRGSPLISKHHSGWRVHTLTKLDEVSDDNTHYSGIFSLSLKDAEKLRENILEQLTTNLKVVQESKEETAYVFCLDYYPFIKG